MSMTAIPDIPRPAGPLALTYCGEGGALFRLALKTMFLTIVTLGIYRFWMKTRIRRYYWSSIRIDGQPLEFTGTGLEMFLGFLIAVTFLAIYLGAISLMLSFAGIVVFSDTTVMQLAATIAVIPLVYYAGYRARRYRLSRTRWRGIRFGMERGAVGYMLTALIYAALAVATLGVLLPLMEFTLRRFSVDRSWYGDLKFTQEGHWTGFLRPWLWVMAALALVAIGFGGLVIEKRGAFGIIAAIGVSSLMIAWVHYRVAATRYAYSHTRLGKGVRFTSTMRTGRIIGIYVVGFILIGIITGAVLTALGLIGAGLASALDLEGFLRQILRDGNMPGRGGDVAAYLGFGAVALAYLVSVLLALVLNEVFIVQPLLRHYVETMSLNGTDELDEVVQRERDAMTEAEGLADALDVGAAF